MAAATKARRQASHVVQFDANEEELTEAATAFLVGGLRHGDTAIVVATPGHREAFEQRLSDMDLDVAAARTESRLCVLDAAEILASFMSEGRVDAKRFDATVGRVVRRAAQDGAQVRIYGEMVAVLWEAGDVGSAMELERQWNELASRTPLSLFCAYCSTSDQGASGLASVLELHTAVVGKMHRGCFDTPIPVEMATRTFLGDLLDARNARHFAIETLADSGHHDLLDDAAVIVAELAANAVMHARSPFTVTLSSHDDRVKIAVRDNSPVTGDLRETATLESGGRGLFLVSTLSADWGTDTDGSGKTIWAELVA
ncbi:MAG: MEDS domain-containing protein [Acidimicrobiales bacterium]